MANQQVSKRKVNPQKFAMWSAIGSILMMFAGFTSGLIVRKSQGNWLSFELPSVFYYSTAAIVLSSITLWFALKFFRQREMRKHEVFVVITLVLGLSFAIMQYIGFKEMFSSLPWNNNVSLQYIVVIIGVHALHILGGVIALFFMFLRTFSRRKKTYSSTGLEIISTYWHFVDILWVYLFIFFIITK